MKIICERADLCLEKMAEWRKYPEKKSRVENIKSRVR